MNCTDKINVTALIAEQKILEAIKEGQFDNLPGRGEPQKMEDLSNLPEELRLAYTVLKNSGFLNGEEPGGNRLPGVRELMSRCEDREGDGARLERLRFLLARTSEGYRNQKEAEIDERLDSLDPRYVDKLLERI